MKYLFLIAILTCSLFGCSDGEEYDRSSPEDTVRSYLEAIEDEDFERLIACVDGFDNIPDSQLQREQMEKTFGNITTKISDIKIAPILKNDNFALLEVSYENDIKYEENSKSIEVQEKIEHTAELVKISSTWLIQFIGDSEGWEKAAKKELFEVSYAVAMVKTNPDKDIDNLASDERILNFNSDETHPIRDMTNSGLITVQGTDVNPVSDYLGKDTTKYYYIIDKSGKVRGFYDSNGELEIFL